MTTSGGSVAVDSDAVVPVLGPPLEAGSGYLAADGCCDSTWHIRAGIPTDNDYWFIQRFAIDWEQVNADNRFAEGDPSDPASYVIYGKEILAVADGTVVRALDGLEDQVPGEFPQGISLEESDGNTVVLDIGDGLSATYAHMQTGSVTVEEGDRVTRGQVLGRVGNTGNSLAPHMHFHVADGPSNFAANGRPYVIDSFAVAGQAASKENFDAVETTRRPLQTEAVESEGEHADELPLDLSLVAFGS